MTKKEIIKAVGEIQTLVGRAKAAYYNDRSPDRATEVTEPLEEAFQKCLEVRGNFPPSW